MRFSAEFKFDPIQTVSWLIAFGILVAADVHPLVSVLVLAVSSVRSARN